jgi:hypothetical protein
MERKVAWNRPTGESDWKLTYTSKCGRYQIVKRHFASYRNGCFNNVGYVFSTTANPSKTSICETLRDAKDEAEMANDENWEP